MNMNVDVQDEAFGQFVQAGHCFTKAKVRLGEFFLCGEFRQYVLPNRLLLIIL